MSTVAQDLPNFDEIKLEKDTDYVIAESAALKAANYLLHVPVNPYNFKRMRAQSFLKKWMDGTPDFTFEIDETATKIAEHDVNVLTLYMAAMAKYCLQNKSKADNRKAVKINAIKTVLGFCENPNNNIKVKGELKKLSAKHEKGELGKYLGIEEEN